MKSMKLSIVVPVYNAARDLTRFFHGLERQSIDRSEVEILMIDGGSTDGTKEICRKHHAKVIHNPHKLTEPGVSVGFAAAQAPIVMILAVDNIFSDTDALETMIRVFDDPTITAAFPKHGTGRGDTVYSWYINTFTDPFTHFVYGDAANARTFHRLYKTLVHTPVYDIYDYTSDPVRPIIALAQGFTVRKSKMPQRTEISDDILTVYTLIDRGDRLAYVHAVTLYHYTIRDTGQFISKQKRAVENALLRADSGMSKRNRYLTAWERRRAYLFFPYALSILIPLVQSILQAVRTKQAAWLIHFFMVFFAAVVILWTGVPLGFRRVLRNVEQGMLPV